ncbi:MAG: PLxRFG domain-containing protein [Chryseolinea sp.]
MTDLTALRKSIPELDGLDDDQAVDVIHQVYYPDMERSAIAARLGVKPPPEPEKKRTWGEAAGDVAKSVAAGVNSALVKPIGELAGLIPGVGQDNFVTNLGDSGAKYWQDQQSDALKQKQAARDAKVAQADGVLDKFLTAAGETLKDPALAVDALAGNAATMIPGAAVGRLAMGIKAERALQAARAVGPVAPNIENGIMNAAAKFGVGAGIGTAAVQQGADVANNAYEGAMAKSVEQLAGNPEYVQRVQAGESPQAVQRDLADRAARAAFLPATAISAAANSIPGATMAERALIGGAARQTLEKNGYLAVLKNIAKGMVGEGTQEAVEEGGGQIAANLANQQIVDPNQDLSAQVGEQAGQGAAGGVLFGASGGAFHVAEVGPLSRGANIAVDSQNAAKAGALEQAAAQARPLALPAPTVTVTPDGTAVTSDQRGALVADALANPREPFTDVTPVPQAAQPKQMGAMGVMGPQEMIDQSLSNIAMWGQRAPGVSLEKAQGYRDSFAQQGQAVTVIPHPAGKGYTVVPSNWLAPFMQNMVPQESDTGRLPAPGMAAPGAPLVDDGGQLRPQTYGDQAASRAAGAQADAEAARKAELGLTPDVERAQERRYLNRSAVDVAQRRQGGEVVPVEGGWVLRQPQEQLAESPAAAPEAPSAGDQNTPTPQFEPGQTWTNSTGNQKYTIISVSKDGKMALADFGRGHTANVHIDAETSNGWHPLGEGTRDQTRRIAGDPIDAEWTAFHTDSGTLGIPRADMPQVKAEHRGAMTNFLNARGIEHEHDEVHPDTLKPTQAEFSPAKVEKAKAFEGGDRSILASEDGHVVDGHHQWLAKHDAGEPLKVIRLRAPVQAVLQHMKEFPSAEQGSGAMATQEQPDTYKPGEVVGETKEVEPKAALTAPDQIDATPRVVGRVGKTPNTAQSIELRANVDGTFTPHVEGHEVLDFDTGEPLKLPADVSDHDAAKAVLKSGSLPRGARLYKAKGGPDTGEGGFSRRSASGNQVPDAVVSLRLAELNNHPEYRLAKAGDVHAALAVAEDLVKPDLITKVKGMADGKPATLVPVASIEAGGRNKIPLAVAEVLADRTGLETTGQIVQVNAPHRTSMDGLQRILSSPVFDGPVAPGGRYILVDDALTQGGTFAALASHIKDNGGEVVGAVALTGKQYSAKIVPSPDLLSQVREKYADVEPAFRAATGYGFDALTESEARYLAKHDAPAGVRDRISEAGDRARQSGDEGGAGFSQTQRGLTSPATDEHVAAVQDIAKQITRRWKNAPDIVVLRSMDDAPQAMREQNEQQIAGGATGSPNAFFYRDKAYLVASELRDEADVRGAIFHEVLGHLGLRGLYGRDLDGILRQIWSARRDEVVTKGLSYGMDMNEPGDQLRAAEEWLAEQAESNPQMGFVRRAVAAIRSWLRRNVPSLANLSLTDDEIIRDFLRPVQRFIKKGEAAGLMGLEPAFRRQDDGMFSRAATPEEAKAQLGERARQTFFDFVGRAGAKVDWLDRSLKTQYAKAQKLPEFGKVFNKVQDYIETFSALGNEAADMAPSILPKLDTMRDLMPDGPKSLLRNGLAKQDIDAIARPIFEGTLAWRREDGQLKPIKEGEEPGGPGSTGVVFTPAELRDKFGLSNDQVKQYQEFRAAIDESIDQITAANVLNMVSGVPDRVKQLATTSEGRKQLRVVLKDAIAESDPLLWEKIADRYDHADKLKENGYTPLTRFGQFFVHVLDKEGQTKYFGLAESGRQSNKLASKLREEFGDDVKIDQGKMSQEAYQLMSDLPLDSLEVFAQAIGADKSDVYQKYLQLAKNNRSTMKRLIHRKGTAGFSEDVPRVLANFLTSNARAVSSSLHIADAKALAEGIRDGDVKDEAIKLINAVTIPEGSASSIRSLMFTNFIGGSIASTVVNLTQPVMMTMPYLSEWGGATKASRRLLAASKMLLSGKIQDTDLREALAKAEKDGIVSPQEIHHLIDRAGGSRLGNHPILQKLAFVWGAPFSLAEQFNRRSTFIAAYLTAQEEGIADPMGFAEKAVVETQGLYNAGNKPNAARGALGATVMTFKQYSIHYLEWLARMARNGKEGKKAALLALGMLALAAGGNGLPFMDDLDDLMDTVGQAMGYDWNSKRGRRQFIEEALGPDMAEIATRGLTAAGGFPVDLSVRMGMGNLIPATDLLKKSNTDTAKSLSEIAGAGGALFKQIFIDGGRSLLDGDVAGAVQKLSPVALQNLAKAVGMLKSGEYKDSKGRKVMDVDGVDVGMKALSFQPSRVARESARISEAMQSETLAKVTQGEIMDKWAGAIADNDKDAEAQALAQRDDWNEKNPHMPIKVNRNQAIKKAKQMRTDRQDRFVKTVGKARRSSVQAEIE